MAIRMRQGLKSDMDPNKLLPGELAVPLDSEEVYACFAPGNVQRMATHEAMKEQIIDATEEVVADLTAGLTAGVNTATSAANTAASAASVATTNANTATSAANTAATRANGVADEAEQILNGDLSSKTVAFTQAVTRANIATGESFATLLGKIKKWFADLNTGAFAAIANNLTTTTAGSVLDATQGKALNDTKANNATSFTQASARTNIASGETIPVVLGKIMKWFTDLKDGAFSTVSNLLTVTTAGYVLDARQGKVLNDAIANLWKTIYPIGSIYFTIVNTNPGTTWGGTWVAWGVGRVPVGVDTTNTNFNTVEKQSGELSHVLSIAELPAHNFTVTTQSGAIASGWTDNGVLRSNDVGYTIEKATNTIGSGAGHNNVQPSVTCYMWKRTA